MVVNHRVTLISTVLNECAGLSTWISAIDEQSLQPDEIIIVDGGSTDGTLDLLRAWAGCRPEVVQVVAVPGASISVGRNHAMQCATGDIIAVTDAGTIADPHWLEHLVRAFDDLTVDVAAGFWTVRRFSVWEHALAAATMPDCVDINPDAFLPSSRSVAFRRSWAHTGVRYPEWLDYCEDLIFDLSLLRAGAHVQFVPDATVEFHVRPSARSFWHQYRQYARGDGKAGLFAKRHALRYITYGMLTATVVRQRPVEWAVVALAGAGYTSRALRRLWRRRRDVSAGDMARAVPCTVALIVLGDIAKMVGYPAGLVWRHRRFGHIGRRTAWQRITPAGLLQRPAAWPTGNPASTSPPDVGSPELSP